MENKFYQDFTLGILGGGQLGRMLIQSAVDFNIDIAILDPDPAAPCAKLTDRFTVGSLTDYQTVYDFGKSCDMVTIEIENVNTDALEQLEKKGKKIYPQPHIIRMIQDKRKQKQFYADKNIPTASFHLVESRADLSQHKDFLPFVNKLGKEGYDGRGVQVIKTEEDLKKGFDAPGLIEKYIPFEKELAVIVSRSPSGQIATFPVVELSFHPTANLVEFLFSPAMISQTTEHKARDIAVRVIEELDMVGLLAVEMFLTREGDILVNEIAPRPHNSGHHTIEANVTSQFEQHLRAIFDLSPGDTASVLPSAMVNILGEDGFTGMAQYDGMEQLMRTSGVHIHLYGKKLTKPFRKMGHITVTGNTVDEVKQKALEAKGILKATARN